MNRAGAKSSPEDILPAIKSEWRHDKMWELAKMEGETNWYEWIETHIRTYVGLFAPSLGASTHNVQLWVARTWTFRCRIKMLDLWKCLFDGRTHWFQFPAKQRLR
jgi:hypothetical protein